MLYILLYLQGENNITMLTERTQTAFRLDTALLGRLKRKARAQGKSLNAFVENILRKEAPAEPEWPKVAFPAEIPDFVKELRLDKPLEFTKEDLDTDPKLDYLVRKHIYGEYGHDE